MRETKMTRWFSTGFTAGNVQAVDAEKHVLLGAVVIQRGEAKGHGMWIDGEFLRAVVNAANSDKFAKSGIKARFGHPNACSDSLGTFLGRWKDLRLSEDGNRIIGNLYLSSVASESPKGDLRKYVEEMAAKEPDHFGASIVFSRDTESEEEYEATHRNEESGFTSGDPDNVKALRHARLSVLHAADLVDDPAATDGMFASVTGAALAAQVTEWLDLHPDVIDVLSEDAFIINVLSRYPDQIGPFLQRYAANNGLADVTELTAEMGRVSTELEAAKSEVEKLQKQSGDQTIAFDAMRVANEALRSEEERLSEKIKAMTDKAEKTESDLETLRVDHAKTVGTLAATQKKLAAYEIGSEKATAEKADESGLTPWQRAQQKQR